jgi:hypothetical protein
VRESLAKLDHAPSELTLQRNCLNVGKVQYALRCSGDRVETAALDAFDQAARHGVEEALGGPVSDESWVQATLGVDACGLGLRDASLVALPAFIASRVAARPLVAEMASHLQEAGICPAAQVMASYDVRSAQAAQRWSQVLPEAVRQEVARLVDDAAAGATRRWRAWCAGEADEPEDPEDPTAHVRPRGSRRPGAGLVPEAGTEDPAHPASPVGAGALRLQRQLTRMMDACAARGLLERARQSGDWERELLLRELSSPDVSHEWLWRIDAHKGPALSPDDYAAAVRLRLGSGGPAEAVPCACCSNALLGPSGLHAMLCARGPSTRGHNAVRDELFKVAVSLDSTTEVEPTGLVPSRPSLRPADVLTSVSGLTGRCAALDVGICCPAAAGAGDDCTEAMRQRKLARMQPHAVELEASGVEYRPVTFSCYGRPHPDAVRLMQGLGRRLARRKGTEAHVETRHLAARIGVEIWRRAARMLRSCLPVASEDVAAQEDLLAPLCPQVLLRVGRPDTVELDP